MPHTTEQLRALRRRRRRAGFCTRDYCPEIPETNPHTGRPYGECEKHRAMSAARQRRHAAKWKATKHGCLATRKCAEPVADGATLCAEHLAAQRERGRRCRERKRHRERIAAQLKRVSPGLGTFAGVDRHALVAKGLDVR